MSGAAGGHRRRPKSRHGDGRVIHQVRLEALPRGTLGVWRGEGDDRVLVVNKALSRRQRRAFIQEEIGRHRKRLTVHDIAATSTMRRAASTAAIAAVATAIALVGAVLSSMPSGRSNQSNPELRQSVSDRAGLARAEAATWMVAQLAPGTLVACDPAVCSALVSHGVPAGNLVTVDGQKGDPLQAAVVVVTSAIRGRLGSRLTAVTAPQPLASFGSGSTEVDVRTVATQGRQAYERAADADLVARRTAGRELLTSGRLDMTTAARSEMGSGGVDPRLLSALATLSTTYRLGVRDFGDGGPGTDVPNRTAVIDKIDGQAVGPDDTAVRAVVRFFDGQETPYRPVQAAVINTTDPAVAVIHIRYGAPTPLGLLNRQT